MAMFPLQERILKQSKVCGCRKRKATTDLAFPLSCHLKEASETEDPFGLLMLDLTKAFYTLPPQTMAGRRNVMESVPSLWSAQEAYESDNESPRQIDSQIQGVWSSWNKLRHDWKERGHSGRSTEHVTDELSPHHLVLRAQDRASTASIRYHVGSICQSWLRACKIEGRLQGNWGGTSQLHANFKQFVDIYNTQKGADGHDYLLLGGAAVCKKCGVVMAGNGTTASTFQQQSQVWQIPFKLVPVFHKEVLQKAVPECIKQNCHSRVGASENAMYFVAAEPTDVCNLVAPWLHHSDPREEDRECKVVELIFTTTMLERYGWVQNQIICTKKIEEQMDQFAAKCMVRSSPVVDSIC